jgi:hypothetical protein
MRRKVGIWIDHQKAVIVFASGDRVTTTTLESKIGPHAAYSDRAEYPTADGTRGAKGERNSEAHYGQLLDRYYDDVVRLVARPEALLIFGPGEAKLQLKERFCRSRGLCDRIVGVHPTDALTDPQIVARVKEHFGIPHPAAGTGASR